MQLTFQFSNPAQRSLYYARARKQCFSGSFNNGKSYGACLKATILLLTFANYRVAIGRQTYADLKKTTMETFFKIMPPEMIESHNGQEGITVLKNGSTVYWLHLDHIDENTLRGLEINMFIGDQAEEFDEAVYLVLLSRIGRWDDAIVPRELIDANPDWPRNKLTGKYLAPSYMVLLCNPDTQLHFIYRRYHPESPEKEADTFFVEASWDTQLGSYEAYQDALKNDPEWVDKYVKGKWSRSSASIHFLPAQGILDPSERLLNRIRERGNLFRVLDHGDSAPTCCLWFAALDGVYICYREYYVPGKVISYHREAIAELSRGEEYSGNYADPQIFKKTAQKDGGFWTVADEYKTEIQGVPELFWSPADNNEFATRNRINELLQISNNYANPVTQEKPAIGIYFVRATVDYPYGCREAPRQLNAQKRKPLGSLNGKIIYSDDRDDSVVDHAYDDIRYFVAMHGSQPTKVRKDPPRNSFGYYNKVREMLQQRAPMAGSI